VVGRNPTTEGAMSQIVTVDFVNSPKPGKKSGNIKCGTSTFFYDPSKFTFVPRMSYEVELLGKKYNGSLMYFVQKAKVLGNDNAQNPGAGQAAEGQGTLAGSPYVPQPDRFWLPFVSNTVAHALTAGFITEPGMIKQWAAAAKQAAVELDANVSARGNVGFDPDDDDPLPF
jgi:hypothetical protein